MNLISDPYWVLTGGLESRHIPLFGFVVFMEQKLKFKFKNGES